MLIVLPPTGVLIDVGVVTGVFTEVGVPGVVVGVLGVPVVVICVLIGAVPWGAIRTATSVVRLDTFKTRSPLAFVDSVCVLATLPV